MKFLTGLIETLDLIEMAEVNELTYVTELTRGLTHELYLYEMFLMQDKVY